LDKKQGHLVIKREGTRERLRIRIGGKIKSFAKRNYHCRGLEWREQKRRGTEDNWSEGGKSQKGKKHRLLTKGSVLPERYEEREEKILSVGGRIKTHSQEAHSPSGNQLGERGKSTPSPKAAEFSGIWGARYGARDFRAWGVLCVLRGIGAGLGRRFSGRTQQRSGGKRGDVRK